MPEKRFYYCRHDICFVESVGVRDGNQSITYGARRQMHACWGAGIKVRPAPI